VGLDVVELKPETLETLDKILPEWWSRNNPVDLVAGMRPGDFVNCLEALLKCDYIDGVLALGAVGFATARAEGFKKSPMTERYNLAQISDLFIMEDARTAQGVINLIDKYQKPVLVAAETSLSARVDKNKSILTLEDNGVLVYPTPDRAADVMAKMAERSAYLKNGSS
jgi:acyl-CoA synthetase (NDP forming)